MRCSVYIYIMDYGSFSLLAAGVWGDEWRTENVDWIIDTRRISFLKLRKKASPYVRSVAHFFHIPWSETERRENKIIELLTLKKLIFCLFHLHPTISHHRRSRRQWYCLKTSPKAKTVSDFSNLVTQHYFEVFIVTMLLIWNLRTLKKILPGWSKP